MKFNMTCCGLLFKFKIHIQSISYFRIVVECVYTCVCVYVKKTKQKKLHSASHSRQTLKKGQEGQEERKRGKKKRTTQYKKPFFPLKKDKTSTNPPLPPPYNSQERYTPILPFPPSTILLPSCPQSIEYHPR